MIKRLNNILMSPEAGDGGGSGGSSSSILTAPQSGGAAPAASAGGNPTQGATGGAGNSPANTSTQGGAASDWRSQLPPEIQEDASIKKYSDIAALAQGHVNLQKLVGRDKIPVPGKDSGDEEWKDIFHKLGLPEDPSKYEVKFKDGVKIDQDFAKQFKENSYKLGILPKQAQALADWFSDVNVQAEQQIQTQRKSQMDKEMSSLKQEWGQAFDHKITRAQQVISKFADDELKSYLDKSGLGNDTRLIKLLSHVGENMYSEGRIVGGETSSAITPAQAQEKVGAIFKDLNHPYFVRNHPGHAAAVTEVQDLLKAAGKIKA